MLWHICLCLLAVSTASSMLADVPVPRYSFKYDGKSVSGSESRTLDETLCVRLEKNEYPESDATDWVLWFENDSDRNSGIVSDICDADFVVALPDVKPTFVGDVSYPNDRAVISMNGCTGRYESDDWYSAQEFKAYPRYLRRFGQRQVIENRGGRSSNEEAPFFDVAQDGSGALVAIGWTGDWRATFVNVTNDAVRVMTGLKRTRFYLKPGERLRTSRTLVMNYAKGEDAGNKFRRLILNRFTPAPLRSGARVGLFANELWGGLTSEEMLRRIRLFRSFGLRYEDWWLDAGWYGEGTRCEETFTGDWAKWTGDWKVNPANHPDGLKDVAKSITESGCGMMLWLEPERVAKTSRFPGEHPEWLLSSKEDGNNLLLHYGNDEARRYVLNLISGYVKTLGLSCYRQDFNMPLTSFFVGNDEKDREGVTEIRHVMGLYDLWDELQARHPDLLIDNCSSGGRRLDIECLRRSVFFFRSDYQCGPNANPEVIQVHNAGLSRLIPCAGCTTKRSDLYSLRSSYAPSFGMAIFSNVRQSEGQVDWIAVKKSHDEYLRIRKYLSKDFYNHGSCVFDTSAWAVWQYHDPATGEGVVQAFRRSDSPIERVTVGLKGVRPGQRLWVENLDSGRIIDCGGAFEIVLSERRSSACFLYGPAGVRVSDLGYDPEDSTEFVQKALDSGARRVLLDLQRGPWIVRPLKVRSDTEFIFESDVVLHAKRGEFRGKRDHLLTINHQTNVVLRGFGNAVCRMYKSDYQKPPYERGEWRYALSVYGSKNVTVEGLRFEQSGGDGICIGRNSIDVTVRRCVCDGNLRQGLTLGSGENITVEDTVMSNTAGTPPQAGVDIEPDMESERLVNCRFRNCLTQDNAGNGFELYLNPLSERSKPVSVVIENCRSVNDCCSTAVNGGMARTNGFVKGAVVFRDCSFDNARDCGIRLTGLPADSFSVSFTNCVIRNEKLRTVAPSVRILSGNLRQGPCDGIDFGNLNILNATSGNWFSGGLQGIGDSPRNIRGTVSISADGSDSEEIVLDSAWAQTHLPTVGDGGILPPRLTCPAIADVEIVDACPGRRIALSPVAHVHGARLIFSATEKGVVSFVGRYFTTGARQPQARPLKAFSVADGTALKETPAVGAERVEFSFAVPAPGFYRLVVPDNVGRFVLEESSVPVAIDLSVERQSPIVAAASPAEPFSLWFFAPRESDAFAVFLGGDSYNRFKASVVNAEDAVVAARDVVSGTFLPSFKATSEGLWRIDLDRAKQPHYEWVQADLFGVPGFLFLSSEKTWRTR